MMWAVQHKCPHSRVQLAERALYSNPLISDLFLNVVCRPLVAVATRKPKCAKWQLQELLVLQAAIHGMLKGLEDMNSTGK